MGYFHKKITFLQRKILHQYYAIIYTTKKKPAKKQISRSVELPYAIPKPFFSDRITCFTHFLRIPDDVVFARFVDVILGPRRT